MGIRLLTERCVRERLGPFTIQTDRLMNVKFGQSHDSDINFARKNEKRE
jgi:hypothetical protein